jgi:hypothetical protein
VASKSDTTGILVFDFELFIGVLTQKRRVDNFFMLPAHEPFWAHK